MTRRHKDEPALCPDCPYRGWWEEVKLRLLRKQMTTKKEPPSNMRICQELRRIFGGCPYYPETEKITLYLSSRKTTE